MGSITTGVGLASGIDIENIVNQMISLQRRSAVQMESRVQSLQSQQSGLAGLEGTVLSLSTTITRLEQSTTFASYTTSVSDSTQMSVTASSSAEPGSYDLQTIQASQTHQLLSKGYATADQQPVGPGTLVVSSGGFLDPPTPLDSLNSGAGVRRGTIRVTDRSGSSADIDLSKAYSVADVVDSINAVEGISVTARADGDRLVLEDSSGSTSSNLIVADLGGGKAATDLGIAGSVAATTLTGSSIYSVTDEFTLGQINDGNGLRRIDSAADLKITLTDDSTLEVNLDDAVTLADVARLINDHEDNGGRVSATVTDGRIELEDLSGGGGSSPLMVEDINSASVVRQLGLDATAAGTTLTGNRLAAGMNTVLLRNLNGGSGIEIPGSIELTSRSGLTATIDLSTAETLNDVLSAITTAQTGGGASLQLTARVNDAGTGIVIEDGSGGGGNLIVADTGGGTVAADLGITVDAAQSSVDSGSLKLRRINEATSLTGYPPDGGAFESGSIVIRDSAGNEATITLSSAVKTIGDVLQRINASSDIQVTAALNETGDGFVLIDEAGGAGTLEVEELGGTVAADLRLLGDSVVGSSGKQEISSRLAAVIEVDADDTLNDVVEKLNASASFLTAKVIDDGSAFSSKRIDLRAASSGYGARLSIDDSGLNMGLSTVTEGQDALLRNGLSAASGFLIASGDNTFEGIADGLTVTVKAAGTSAAKVTVAHDTSRIETALQSFVDGYNQLVSTADQLTQFNLESNTKGVLQGSGVVLRMFTRLDSLINGRREVDGPWRSMSQLGIRISTGGKLAFDKDRLSEVLQQDPDAVKDFFLTKDTGFAAIARQTVDGFTDSFTGSLTLQKNSLQTSIDSLTTRIDQLDSILEVRRERLLLEFIQMENAISALNSQQSAISGISLVSGGNSKS
ncbi:MAG: flagellar filament capping protein FliD [Planctomycetaceae bacterium]|nr:flagellar filament capping protein FliD [Planctomycetaceae bacterium]